MTHWNCHANKWYLNKLLLLLELIKKRGGEKEKKGMK
jgi:hypothetical protein